MSRVPSVNSGNDRTRVSVSFPATASGIKLPAVILIPRKNPLKNFDVPQNVRVVYGSSGTFNSNLIEKELIKQVLTPYRRQKELRELNVVLDNATCHTSAKAKKAFNKARIQTSFLPSRLTSMLQPADVSWMRPLKVAYQAKWSQWIVGNPHTFTLAGNLRSPGNFQPINSLLSLIIDKTPISKKGYANVIRWISEIWSDFDSQVIVDSFDKCGITTNDPTAYHKQLRHFVRTNELIEDLIDDEGIEDFEGFDDQPDFYAEVDDDNEESEMSEDDEEEEE